MRGARTLLALSLSAPAASSAWQQSMCPHMAASCSAVFPRRFASLIQDMMSPMFVLMLSSSTARLPFAAASRSASALAAGSLMAAVGGGWGRPVIRGLPLREAYPSLTPRQRRRGAPDLQLRG